MTTPATTIDKNDTGEHWQPSFLPTEKIFSITQEAATVDLRRFERPAGHVFFMRESVLMAQRLNEKSLQLEGEAVARIVSLDREGKITTRSINPATTPSQAFARRKAACGRKKSTSGHRFVDD